MRYCTDRGWKFHLSSLHETHVNSTKLNSFECYCPSFIIDRDFNDSNIPLIWGEIKSCNKEGDIKVSKEEFDIHKAFNEGREVWYVLFDHRNRHFKMIALTKLADFFTAADERYFYFNFNDVPE
jgi:hypothetical protein